MSKFLSTHPRSEPLKWEPAQKKFDPLAVDRETKEKIEEKRLPHSV